MKFKVGDFVRIKNRASYNITTPGSFGQIISLEDAVDFVEYNIGDAPHVIKFIYISEPGKSYQHRFGPSTGNCFYIQDERLEPMELTGFIKALYGV